VNTAREIICRAIVLSILTFLCLTPSMAKIKPPRDIKLVFTTKLTTQTSDIFLLESLDGKPINLTQNPAPDSYPRWSPDGRRIAFVSERDGDEEIYIMDIKTRKVERLTHHPGGDRYPTWSPDGRKIAFLSSGENGKWDLRLIDLITRRVKILSKVVTGSFDWHPDGRRLILGHRDSRSFYFLDVNRDQPVRDFQEMERVSIPHILSQLYSLSCCRDGVRIAYGASETSAISDIHVLDLRNGRYKNLSKLALKPPGRYDNDPRWTPDGKFILFSSNRDGNGSEVDIYLMTDEGEIAERIELEGTNYFPDAFDPKYAYPVPDLTLRLSLWGLIKR